MNKNWFLEATKAVPHSVLQNVLFTFCMSRIDALLGQMLATGFKWYKVHELKCYWIAKLVGGFSRA